MVLSSVLDGAAVVVLGLASVALGVVSAVGEAVVLAGVSLDGSVEAVVGVSVVATVSPVVGSAVVSSEVALVLSAGVVVETPVPTTCLFGMMPSGISSARIVAKPKEKRASMVMAKKRWESINNGIDTQPAGRDLASCDGVRGREPAVDWPAGAG